MAEGAEVGQHAAVRGATVADREDDPVATLGDGLVDGRDGERLRAVPEDEVVELRAGGDGGENRLLHAHGMLGARGDDHERL